MSESDQGLLWRAIAAYWAVGAIVGLVAGMLAGALIGRWRTALLGFLAVIPLYAGAASALEPRSFFTGRYAGGGACPCSTGRPGGRTRDPSSQRTGWLASGGRVAVTRLLFSIAIHGARRRSRGTDAQGPSQRRG
jgi:hypothetical protein